MKDEVDNEDNRREKDRRDEKEDQKKKGITINVGGK